MYKTKDRGWGPIEKRSLRSDYTSVGGCCSIPFKSPATSSTETGALEGHRGEKKNEGCLRTSRLMTLLQSSSASKKVPEGHTGPGQDFAAYCRLNAYLPASTGLEIPWALCHVHSVEAIILNGFLKRYRSPEVVFIRRHTSFLYEMTQYMGA